MLRKDICDRCNYCFEASLELDRFKRNYKPFDPEDTDESFEYLVVYSEPNLNMLENDFKIEKRCEGYARFLKLLGDSYICIPLFSGVVDDEIKPTSKQRKECLNHFYERLEKLNYQDVIILGKTTAKYLGIRIIDDQCLYRMMIFDAVKAILVVESPSISYFSKGSLLRNFEEVDRRYQARIELLQNLTHL